MSRVCAAALNTPATLYQVFNDRMVLLYRCVRDPAPPETATANVWGPVSGLVFSCQPVVLSDLPMMIPSSAGLAAAYTHALHVALPESWRGDGLPRSTYAEEPSNDRALPYFPALVQAAPMTVPASP